MIKVFVDFGISDRQKIPEEAGLLLFSLTLARCRFYDLPFEHP